MPMNIIKCQNCGTEIELDKALESQIEARLSARIDERHRRELLKVKSDAEAAAKRTAQDFVNEQIQKVRKQADEEHRLKELELQKQLSGTKKALDDARRKAEQSSTQIQGEVAETELENLLRREFPADGIDEVKNGRRGADIVQTVKNNRSEACGILLWESKNALWQKEWIPKLKDDIVSSGASAGIIVSRKMPEQYGDMFNFESNVWIVKPSLVLPLAAALRSAVLQVYSANSFSSGKDGKLERLYQYLIGAEFGNRIKAIVDNYKILQDEIEKERRAAQLRWARQEKAIRNVIDNTFGFYGDIQGLTGGELQESLLIETDNKPK